MSCAHLVTRRIAGGSVDGWFLLVYVFGPWLASTVIISSNPAGGSPGQLLKQLQLHTEAQLSCSQEMARPSFQSRSSRYFCIDDEDCEDTPGTPCHNIII